MTNVVKILLDWQFDTLVNTSFIRNLYQNFNSNKIAKNVLNAFLFNFTVVYLSGFNAVFLCRRLGYSASLHFDLSRQREKKLNHVAMAFLSNSQSQSRHT